MRLQLIRNATLRLDYAGQPLLIDPFLAPKHSRPSFTGKSLNPMVDLPCAPEVVYSDRALTLISHLHADHFDPRAQELLPKAMPILCQPNDAAQIASKGFRDVTPVHEHVVWRGITITRTPGQHGSGEVLAQMGETSGFVFEAEGEPTVYWAGDTILTDAVKAVIARFTPQLIVTHSCGAVWGEPQTLIVMDAAQTAEVCQLAPEAVVVATHMDALDHATVSREDLRQFATVHGISPDQLLIPADGERLSWDP